MVPLLGLTLRLLLKPVEEGDYCIWDADDGVWRFIGSVGGGSGTLTGVDATLPLSVNTDNPEVPVVESREATQHIIWSRSTSCY